MKILNILRLIVLLTLVLSVSVQAAETDQLADPVPEPAIADSMSSPKLSGGRANPTPNMAQSPGNLLNVTAGLAVVLGLIGLAAWLLRRFGQFQVSASGHLKIVGGLHLSAREKIVLIQVGEQQLLVGISPGSVRTLHVLDSPLTVHKQQESGGLAFAEKLQGVLTGIKR